MNSDASNEPRSTEDTPSLPASGSSTAGIERAQVEQVFEPQRAQLTELMFRLTAAVTVLHLVAKGTLLSFSTPIIALPLAITFAGLLVAYVLIRKNRHDLAALIFTYPNLLVLTYATISGGGLQSGAAAFFLPVLIYASATLSRRKVGLLAAGSLVSVMGVAYADINGLLPAPTAVQPTVAWLSFTCALVMSGILIHAILKALHAVRLELIQTSKQHQDAQARYFNAQKLEPVAQLASGIAHDFNNLLGVIANVSSSLRSELMATESSHELLNDLDEATARASLMTGQLLAFSRRRALKMAVIDLEEFVQSLTPILGRLLGDEIQVACVGTTKGLTVNADRGHLEQVLLNLVVNARDAMPKGGRLTICMGATQARQVYLEVTDTGVGIPEEVRPKIFTAFFTTKTAGTGLGLATVADIVGRLNGTIEVESTWGEGTTFRILLPSSGQPASAARKSLSRFRSGRKTARILLAEDHELMRRGTQRVLEHAGYTVTSVVNGQEALALILGGGRFDLLITDVSMPVLSGFDLVERLAGLEKGFPTLFVSGDSRRVPPHFDAFPFKVRFLAKPFAQEDLIDGIEKCLSQSPSRRHSSMPSSRGRL